MKIAFVTQPIHGFALPPHSSLSIWTYEIARRLARTCDVTVFTRRFRPQPWEEDHEGVHIRRVPTRPDDVLIQVLRESRIFRTAKRPLFASRLYYLRYGLEIAWKLRQERFDVVHVQNFSQLVPIIRTINPNIKIALHMQCEWLTQLDRGIIAPRLDQADLITSCSDYVTRKIREAYPEAIGRCQTLYNGVDPDLFVPSRMTDQSGRDGSERLLFVGRVSPEKGVHVLLDAFHAVATRYPKARLVIVGPLAAAPIEFTVGLSDDPRDRDILSFYPGGYQSHLQSRISPALAGQISFLPAVPQPELLSHYRDSDVFVFPSLWEEPFGMPVIEAMSCEVPVVTTRSGGITELIEDGETGRLVDRGDASGLADAILDLLAQPERRRSMGKAGRERVIEQFSWDRIADQLLHALESLPDRTAFVDRRDGRVKTSNQNFNG